jgi:hypothetical protein
MCKEMQAITVCKVVDKKIKKETGKRAEEKHTESLTKKMFVDGVGVDIGPGHAHM